MSLEICGLDPLGHTGTESNTAATGFLLSGLWSKDHFKSIKRVQGSTPALSIPLLLSPRSTGGGA